jgi:hypothetical protein
MFDFANPDEPLVRSPVPSPQLLSWNDRGLIVSAENAVYRIAHDGLSAELIVDGVPDDIWTMKPSPSGTYLLYVDEGQLYWFSTVDDEAVPTRVSEFELPFNSGTYGWSRDERWLAFMATVEQTGVHVWSPLAPDEPPLLVGEPLVLSENYGFSPDGTRFLVTTNGELWIRRVEAMDEAPAVVAGSGSARWSPTGRYVLYGSTEGEGVLVPVAEDGIPETPVVIPGMTSNCTRYWTDDDSRFYHRPCDGEELVLNVAEIEATDPPSVVIRKVADLAGGSYDLWHGHCLLQWGSGAMRLRSLDAPESDSVLSGDYWAAAPDWAADGSGITWPGSAAHAYFAPVDPESCTFTGEAVLIAETRSEDIRGSVFLDR